MNTEAPKPTSADLRRDKEARIKDYLRLQDEADAVNKRIYETCCEIEALRLRIVQAEREEAEEARRKALAAGKPGGNESSKAS